MKYDFLAQYFKLSDPLEKMYVTQGFGVNGVQLYEDLGLDGHNGIDLRARYIPTYATIDAQVISSGQDYTGGRFVKYRPDDVYIDGIGYRLEIIHYHLDTYDVSAGDKIKRGQEIGITGNTGWSTAPHLHFGIKYFEKRPGKGWVKDINNGYAGAINPATFLLSMNGLNIEPNKPKEIKSMVFLKSAEDSKVFAQLGGQYVWLDMSFEEFTKNFPSNSIVELSAGEFSKLPISNTLKIS